MTATTDETADRLFAAARQADPAALLPWLVLADRLDEVGDPRADRIRWWCHWRPTLTAPLPWGKRTHRDEVDSLDFDRRVTRLHHAQWWLCRLYGIEFVRTAAARWWKSHKRRPWGGKLDRLLAITVSHAFEGANGSELHLAAEEACDWWMANTHLTYASRFMSAVQNLLAGDEAACVFRLSNARYPNERLGGSFVAVMNAAELSLSRYESAARQSGWLPRD